MLPNASRDGCDCPPWVVRCVHWDGKILALGANAGTGDYHTCAEWSGHGMIDFHIEFINGFRPCGQDGCVSVVALIDSFDLLPDLPAAEAEFSRREAQLLSSSESSGA